MNTPRTRPWDHPIPQAPPPQGSGEGMLALGQWGSPGPCGKVPHPCTLPARIPGLGCADLGRQEEQKSTDLWCSCCL